MIEYKREGELNAVFQVFSFFTFEENDGTVQDMLWNWRVDCNQI